MLYSYYILMIILLMVVLIMPILIDMDYVFKMLSRKKIEEIVEQN